MALSGELRYRIFDWAKHAVEYPAPMKSFYDWAVLSLAIPQVTHAAVGRGSIQFSAEELRVLAIPDIEKVQNIVSTAIFREMSNQSVTVLNEKYFIDNMNQRGHHHTMVHEFEHLSAYKKYGTAEGIILSLCGWREKHSGEYALCGVAKGHVEFFEYEALVRIAPTVLSVGDISGAQYWASLSRDPHFPAYVEDQIASKKTFVTFTFSR